MVKPDLKKMVVEHNCPGLNDASRKLCYVGGTCDRTTREQMFSCPKYRDIIQLVQTTKEYSSEKR